MAALGGMAMTSLLLICNASPRIILGEEERLRALRHACSALPRTAQALYDQVRQPSCAAFYRAVLSARAPGAAHGMAEEAHERLLDMAGRRAARRHLDCMRCIRVLTRLLAVCNIVYLEGLERFCWTSVEVLVRSRADAYCRAAKAERQTQGR